MANPYSPILSLPQAFGLNGQEWFPLVKGGTTSRAQTGAMVDAVMVQFPAAIEFITGVRGGAAITPGRAGWLTVPFGGTLTSATLLGDQVGSIVMDIWNTSYANFPTVTSTFSITGGNPPTISGGVQYQDNTLANWTTTLSSGNILIFNINSIATFNEVTLSLTMARSLI